MLSIVIPFFNGHATIKALLSGIPDSVPVFLVDDVSDVPYKLNMPGKNVRVIRLQNKGYFTGAVNMGINAAGDSDVLVLNQDVTLHGTAWFDLLMENKARYAMIGECIRGKHPAWEHGYIHGTFMFLRRDAISKVGLLNDTDYPLWGSTCEYQVRLCRAGYEVLPLRFVPGFKHERAGKFGSSINTLLQHEPKKREWFIRTPPMISVIVPCYNYGRYLPDLVNSLVGGDTSLGRMPGQTFQSFEVVIVNDASTDDTAKYIDQVCDGWNGVRAVHLAKNGGTAKAINAGVKASYGKYITIIGADDMMESFRLEKLYRAAVANPHRFIYDNLVCFADGRRRPDIKVGVSAYNFEVLLKKNHVHAGILAPLQAWNEIGGYPENFGDGREDWAVNVALGIKGWCGVLIPEVGYLYRRERQNRSLTNTSPNHHKAFLAKLIKTFPNIYAGERPDMCCGQARTRATGATPNRGVGAMATNLKAKGVQADSGGTVLLRYVGKSQGTQAFYGPKSGKMYEAGLSRPLIPVQSRDLHSGRLSTPGLLDVRESGRGLFVVEPPAKPQAVPVQEPLPEAVEEIVAEIIAVEPDIMPVVEVESDDVLVLPIDTGTLGLTDLEGVNAETAEKLNQAGVTTISELTHENAETLSLATGISKTKVKKIIAAARKAYDL